MKANIKLPVGLFPGIVVTGHSGLPAEHSERKGLRIRDLRAGDVIEVGKDFYTVYAIEVYR